jgi:adenosylcobinamide-phosphate synthase
MDIRGFTKSASAVSRSVRAENYARGARYASQLSHCDCKDFEMNNIVRASVQGLADRTVDSITAPLLFMFLLSGAGAIFWKAVDCAATNIYTDSEHGDAFANSARRLHSALCVIPGKLAAVIMLVDALFLKLNTRTAERTMKRDSEKCRRTCFGGCRAVLAGIMGISLLPEEVFSEQFLRTYTIGEHLKEPAAQDVTLASHLMLGTSFIIMMLCFAIKLTVGVWF